MAEIPQWAIERAHKLWMEVAGAEVSVSTVSATALGVAFASYVAAHESEPVDPILLEAREVVARVNVDTDTDCGWIAEVRDGKHDTCDEILVAVAALRRGIELAKEQTP